MAKSLSGLRGLARYANRNIVDVLPDYAGDGGDLEAEYSCSEFGPRGLQQ